MNTDDSSQFNRRDFLNSSASGLAVAMASGAVLELTPQVLGQAEDSPKNDSTPPINVGMIGCGVWGRELEHDVNEAGQRHVRQLLSASGIAWLERKSGERNVRGNSRTNGSQSSSHGSKKPKRLRLRMGHLLLLLVRAVFKRVTAKERARRLPRSASL